MATPVCSGVLFSNTSINNKHSGTSLGSLYYISPGWHRRGIGTTARTVPFWLSWPPPGLRGPSPARWGTREGQTPGWPPYTGNPPSEWRRKTQGRSPGLGQPGGPGKSLMSCAAPSPCDFAERFPLPPGSQAVVSPPARKSRFPIEMRAKQQRLRWRLSNEQSRYLLR